MSTLLRMTGIALSLAFLQSNSWGVQDAGAASPLQLPAADQLDVLGLGDVPRSAPGTWADLFVNHQPDAARMAEIAPQVARLATQAQASFGQADYPRCLAQSREVLRILPDFPPSLLVYASAAFRLRRYGDCKVAMDRFVDAAPTEIWRTQILGHSLYSLGKYEAARDHYIALIEGAPSPKLVSAEARRGLALAHYRLGNDAMALKQLGELVEAYPNHGDAWAWLAQIQFDGDALDDALHSANRAIELLPYEPRPYFLAYRILFDLERDEEAEQLEQRWRVLDEAAAEIRTLSNRLLFHPGEPGLLRGLAVQHRDIGNLRGLSGALEQLLATQDFLDPTGLQRRIFAIEAFRDMGAIDRARELLRRTAADYPGAGGLPDIPAGDGSDRTE